MMSATARTLLRLLDAGKITMDQIAETTKWMPYKVEVETALREREGVV